MRFTSLIVELIRSRPGLVVWIVLVVQAAIWFAVPSVFFSSPPGEVATVLAYGREYQVGSALGPPLAFWLADAAYRAAGNHIAGVYFLAQLCFIAAFASLYQLGRAILGGPHAVLAVVLTMTVLAFGRPAVEFGPRVLTVPLWAWALLATWRIVGQRRRSAWFALSIAAGLLLLTTRDAWWLLLSLAVFMTASARGRRQLASLDPLYALLVIGALALPWLIWLTRTGGMPGFAVPAGALDHASVQSVAVNAAWLLAFLLLSGVITALLIALNSRWLDRGNRRIPPGPTIVRAAVDPLAKRFVYGFAIAPPLISSLLGTFNDPPAASGGAGTALLMVGLATIVLSGEVIALRQQRRLRRAWAFAIVLPALTVVFVAAIVPWIGGAGPSGALPAAAMARFFAESFERRTGHPLPAVAGDPDLAALVAMGPSRPHLLLDASPERTPWITKERLAETGGLVLWHATDTLGAPPPELTRRFPDLVPEVPRAFEHFLNGRQAPPRIGWAIVRPKAS